MSKWTELCKLKQASTGHKRGYTTTVYLVYGQVARKSSRPKLCRPKSESCRPKCFVKSPEMLSYLARNFIMPQQYPSIRTTICRDYFVSSKIIERDTSLIYRACFVVDPGLKIEIYYTFIPLALSHHRLKNEVCYTFIPLVSSHDG